MAMLSPMELLNWLGQYQFLAPAQVDELRPLLPGFPDSMGLAKELIRRDWLTPYQVNQIMQGKHEQLVLGNYRLRERIGEGAMGQVFKAWNLRMACVVAIKTIHKEHISSSKAMDRFRREVETAAQLVHPNIALVRDADEVEGRPFLVMDYIEGIDLSQKVKKTGPLPIQEAAEVIRQAALGLQQAFEKGIVHRDIKPGNLIVATKTRSGESHPVVKILDFGLARYESERENVNRLTQVGNLLGTVDYVAPEQAQNARTADIRADIYSLGCTMYYLLTGQAPFAGDSVVEKIGPRLTGDPPRVSALRPEVPAALDQLLYKMMARQPGNRFQTPIEVAHALQPFTVKVAAHAPSMSPAGVMMAQPVAEGAVASGTVLQARPVAAAPGAAATDTAPVASAFTTDDPPFGEAAEDALGERASAEEQDPSFLDMTATGRDISTDGTVPTPTVAGAKGPFPIKLALILGGGGLLFSIALCLGVCVILPLFDSGKKKVSNGTLIISNAKFSMPDKTVRPGETKRILVYIQRKEFKGPVSVTLKDLPDGVVSKTTVIPPNANSGDVSFTVSYGTEPQTTPIRIYAECETEEITAEMTVDLKIVEDPLKGK